MSKFSKIFFSLLTAILIFPLNFSSLKPGYTDYVSAASRPEDNLSDVTACSNFSHANQTEKVFPYVLRGTPGEIKATMYPDLANCLDGLKRETSLPQAPHAQKEDTDDKLMINNVPQTENLKEIAENIEKVTPDKNDQARIAVSLVQGFKYEEKDPDDYEYPYEVAFDQKGICNETAKLLLNLFQHLGFDAAMFTFEKDNHQAVGIKCDAKYSFQNTGYCFVETTSRAIITDNVEENTPVRVNQISSGLTFDASSDWQDAQQYMTLIKKKNLSSEEKTLISNLKEKYGLGEKNSR